MGHVFHSIIDLVGFNQVLKSYITNTTYTSITRLKHVFNVLTYKKRKIDYKQKHIQIPFATCRCWQCPRVCTALGE